MNDNQKEMYERWGKTPPTSEPHGTPEEIAKNMVKLKPTSWRQEGNKLIGETPMGPLVQFIPTDMLLMGTDEKGLPILQKMVV